LVPEPAGVAVAVMAVPSPEAAMALLSFMADRLGDGISAFELIHRQGPDFLVEVGPDVRVPLAEVPDWMVLTEVGLPHGLSPQDALEDVFVAASEAGLVSDGVIAQSEAQRHAFWSLRESIPEANRRIGSISSHDISVPTSLVPEFIDRAGAMLARMGEYRINCFGHLGDGNLHYNVFPAKGRTRADYPDDAKRVKRAVHDLVHELAGSVSAEHGIGRLKVDDLERYGDPAKLAMMRAIKDALDPEGIMNPGAVLRLG
jgi:FAD/FMN-containing dehydrogenase